MLHDTRRAYQQLVKKLEPSLRRAFRQSIADIVGSAVLIEVEAAIVRGDVDAVMRALNLSPEFFSPLDRAISLTFLAGAEAQLATVPKRPVAIGATRVIVRFNGRHPRAEALIREQSSRLIVEIIDDQRTLIRQVLDSGLTESAGQRRTALKLAGKINAAGRRSGGLVGLTSQQASYVNSMSAELKLLDKHYFTRTLRDRRFDSTVRKAIEAGKPLSKADIDKITGRYSGRLLKARGKTIARTETHAALNKGKSEGIDQLIDNGRVTNEMVTKIWDATPSGRTRDTHSKLNGQQKPKAEAFVSPSGARMMYPLDSSLGASGAETINCRCSVRYRIDYLQQAI